MDEQRILCACGCGGEVRKAKFPSQQPRYINTHQHRGEHNGNYRGGKIEKVCPVCLKPFKGWPSQYEVTCGEDACYRKWQGMKVSARQSNKVSTECAWCGKVRMRFPSQVKEKNFCGQSCLGKYSGLHNPGNWQGGKWPWIKGQVLVRDGHRCVICGFDLVVDAHHIIRRKSGGTDEFTNLVTLCPNHHRMADLRLIGADYLSQFAIPVELDPVIASRLRTGSECPQPLAPQSEPPEPACRTGD